MISTWEHLLKSLVSIVLFRYNLLHYVVVIVSQVYTISNYTYGNEIIENLEFVFRNWWLDVVSKILIRNNLLYERFIHTYVVIVSQVYTINLRWWKLLENTKVIHSKYYKMFSTVILSGTNGPFLTDGIVHQVRTWNLKQSRIWSGIFNSISYVFLPKNLEKWKR